MHLETRFEGTPLLPNKGSLPPLNIMQPSHHVSYQDCTSFRRSLISCWDPFQAMPVLEFRWASRLADLSDELHPKSLPALSGALHSPTVGNKSKINIQDIQKGWREAVMYYNLITVGRRLCIYLSCIFISEPCICPGTFRSLILYHWLLRNCFHNAPISNPKIINEASTVTCSFDVFVSKCSVQTILFLKRGNSCYAYKDPAAEVARELMRVWTAPGIWAKLREDSERYNPQTLPGFGYQKMRKGNTKSHVN